MAYENLRRRNEKRKIKKTKSAFEWIEAIFIYLFFIRKGNVWNDGKKVNVENKKKKEKESEIKTILQTKQCNLAFANPAIEFS